MARLRFLGWEIEFADAGDTIYPVPGAKLALSRQGKSYRLGADIDAVIDGIRVYATVIGLDLRAVAGVWVPDRVAAGTIIRFQMLRAGENPANFEKLRILAGPIADSVAPTAPASFNPATGGLRLGLARSLIASSATAAAVSADLINLQTIEIRLAATSAGSPAGVLFPTGSHLAKLKVCDKDQVELYPAVTFHSVEKFVPFAQSAKAAPTLMLGFTRDLPDMPVRLAVTRDGPGMIAHGGDLELGLRADAGRAVLDDLALVGGVTLECLGVWDSHNRPERWSTPRVPLAISAFAPGEAGFRCPLVRPGIKDLPLVRLDRWRGATPLPMHGHPSNLQYVFGTKAIEAALVADADYAEPCPPPAWLDTALAWRRSRPYLRAPVARFAHSRPGDSFTGGDAGVWRFEGVTAAIPLLPVGHWTETGDPAKLSAANVQLDRALAALTLRNPQAQHESGLDDVSTGKPPAILAFHQNALSVDPKRRPEPLRLTAEPQKRLLRSDLTKAAADLNLEFRSPTDALVDYSVGWVVDRWAIGKTPPKLDQALILSSFVNQLIDPGVPVALGGWHAPAERAAPVALLKTGRNLNLAAILKDISDRLTPYARNIFAKEVGKDGGDLLARIKAVDPSVLENAWVGLLLIRFDLNLDKFPQLAAMVPAGTNGAPVFDFVAIAPKHASGTAVGGVSGSIDWQRGTDQPTDFAQSVKPGVERREARFWAERLAISWRDGRLVNFQSEAVLELRSLFGAGYSVADAKADKPLSLIRIYGSAKRRQTADPEYDFRFAARATDVNPRGLRVYPIRSDAVEAEDHLVREVWMRSIELIASTQSANTAEIRIDGDAVFGKPKFITKAGDFLKGDRVQFLGLGINLPTLGDFTIPALDIHYPNLRFNLNLPHVDLLDGAFRLKFNQVDIDWDGLFNFEGLPDLGIDTLLGAPSGWKVGVPSFLLRGILSFGDLPELFGRAVRDFTLEVVFGLQIDLGTARPFDWIRIGVRGVEFDELDLDLLRFVRVRIEKLVLGEYAPTKSTVRGKQLMATKVEAWILRYKLPFVLSGAYASIQGGGGDAFWLLTESENTDQGLFDFKWGFVGQNLTFDQNLVKGLLETPTMSSTVKPVDPMPTRQLLADAWTEGSLRPRLESEADDTGAWVFGASVAACAGAFEGRALVQDRGFVGVSLTVNDKGPGKAIVEYFGADFAILGIYAKGATPGEDSFYMSLALGGVTMPAFRLIAGSFAVTIYANGSFVVDFGFPLLAPGGGRMWERTIGAIITPGQASAGFYFRKLERTNIATGSKEIVLGAGFALQWGIGGAWGGGVFEAWLRVGLYVVMEGEITFTHDGSALRLSYLKVTGVGGILLEGRGRIDWWVISVEVGIRASAEIRTTLTYDVASHVGNMLVTAELYVSANASACIGGGPFRVCKSVHVGLSVPIDYQLRL